MCIYLYIYVVQCIQCIQSLPYAALLLLRITRCTVCIYIYIHIYIFLIYCPPGGPSASANRPCCRRGPKRGGQPPPGPSAGGTPPPPDPSAGGHPPRRRTYPTCNEHPLEVTTLHATYLYLTYIQQATHTGDPHKSSAQRTKMNNDIHDMTQNTIPYDLF